MDQEEDLYGKTLYKEQEILVQQDLPNDNLKSTLFHEALHAASDSAGHDWDEETVSHIERVVFALMRDNPPFIRWLLSK